MPDLFFTMQRPAPCRAEVFLRQDCGLSHRQLSHLKAIPGGITVNGSTLRTIDIVEPGTVVRLHLEDTSHLIPNPSLHVPVVFEDDDLLVFDKPAGMPVHPSQNHREDTLGNAFAAVWQELTFRPVHRLDQDTSGLTAVAKHALAASFLPSRLTKTYLALTDGTPPEEGTVNVPIARVPDSIIARRAGRDENDGKHAVTHFRVLSRGKYTLLALTLETGRTHQIRVHMAHIGCPLAGDGLYGGNMTDISRHALHCAALDYVDRSGTVQHIVSPLPKDMVALLE